MTAGRDAAAGCAVAAMTGRVAASVHRPERQALLLLAQELRVRQPLAQVSVQELLLQEQEQLLEPQLVVLPQHQVPTQQLGLQPVPQMRLERLALQLLEQVLRVRAPLALVQPLPLPAFHLAVRIYAFSFQRRQPSCGRG